jgi:hypothetical protein
MNADLQRVVGAAVLLASLGPGAPGPATVRAEEEIWLVSTREIPSCTPPAEARPRYWRLGADQQWAASEPAAFFAAHDPAVPTIFFVHGNRSDANDAIQTGWDIYQCLREQAGGRPLRFVVWSWPADRIPGRNRPDVRIKAARSDVEAGYLAEALGAIPPRVPISLVGYSFGARTICGALALLPGGGASQGAGGGREGAPRAPIRAVLVAAAVDDSALAPCGASGGALGPVDRVLVTCNPADHALRWYRHMERRRGPGALGFRGPACVAESDPLRPKLELVNLACEVGKDHTWAGYIAAPSIRSRLAWYAFLQPAADAAPAATASIVPAGSTAVAGQAARP